MENGSEKYMEKIKLYQLDNDSIDRPKRTKREHGIDPNFGILWDAGSLSFLVDLVIFVSIAGKINDEKILLKFKFFNVIFKFFF